MQQCSICLDDLEGGPTLACGHRFHAACLARLAGANGTTPTRRGALTACPNCRTVSRVALTPVAEPAPARTARPPPVRATPAPPPAPPPRASGPPPAPRAIVPRARPRARPAPAPAPSALKPHVASTASAWFTVCTDLLDVAKDRTNMRGLREPLVSRGFCCGPARPSDGGFNVTVSPDFPCYYDVVGKDYTSNQNSITNPTTLKRYLEGVLALARAGDAYRTDAEYKDARTSALASAKTSRFTGVHWDTEKGKLRAAIKVRMSNIFLGHFDDEEEAARAYDAALVKYKGKPTVNFPGEAPLASVLAALPDLPSPPPPASLPEKRTRTPKVIVDAPDERPANEKRRAKRPRKRENGKPGKWVEGAQQKKNGKWSNRDMFPGREFDDLDAYRAAKRQRAARRAAYSEQTPSKYKK